MPYVKNFKALISFKGVFAVATIDDIPNNRLFKKQQLLR